MNAPPANDWQAPMIVMVRTPACATSQRRPSATSPRKAARPAVVADGSRPVMARAIERISSAEATNVNASTLIERRRADDSQQGTRGGRHQHVEQ